MAFRLRSGLKFLIILPAFVILLFVLRSVWLAWLGYALVHDDGPGKADIAVVLAGDLDGQRIDRAARLVQQGYVPAVLVSGPDGFYGFHESDLAIRWAHDRGYPFDWFIALPNTARSTRMEARIVLAELQRRNIHSFLLVTSDFHTARARRIYLATERELGLHFDMRTVAAKDRDFRPNSWWRDRQGEKVFFLEWCKTVATALGI